MSITNKSMLIKWTTQRKWTDSQKSSTFQDCGDLVAKPCLTLATPERLLCPCDSQGKNTGVGCHFFFQGIFLTQGLNPGFLHCRQILYQLSCEGSPIMNKPVTDTEIKTLIKKNLPKNKSSGPDGFKGEFYQIQRRVNAYPSKTLPNNFREGTLPKSFYEATITVISKPDKDMKKENYRPISLMNIDAKILNKILSNRIQEHIKKIIP